MAFSAFASLLASPIAAHNRNAGPKMRQRCRGGRHWYCLAKFVISSNIIQQRKVSGKIMMFRRQMTVLAAIAMALAGAMEAQARPDTRTMTCPQAKAFVKQNKAIVMSTGPSTYERIVIGQGLCSSTQIAKLIVAPTVDERKCRVGYTCEEAPNDR
jgi:hypothetical protein